MAIQIRCRDPKGKIEKMESSSNNLGPLTNSRATCAMLAVRARRSFSLSQKTAQLPRSAHREIHSYRFRHSFVLMLIDNICLYRAINEIGKNLHDVKDILADLKKEYNENIDLATKLGYERAMKDVAEKRAYARSWEEGFKNAS